MSLKPRMWRYLVPPLVQLGGHIEGDTVVLAGGSLSVKMKLPEPIPPK